MEGVFLFLNRAYAAWHEYDASIRRMASCMRRNERGGYDPIRTRLMVRVNTIIGSFVTDTLNAKKRQQSGTTCADEQGKKSIRSRRRPLPLSKVDRPAALVTAPRSWYTRAVRTRAVWPRRLPRRHSGRRR